MTLATALAGWLCAAVGFGHALRSRRRLATGARLAARACHELRGPLAAAWLAADGSGALDATQRLAAVAGELARVRRALDDLAAAPRGARAPDARVELDVGALLAEQAATWAAIAPAHAARIEVSAPAEPLSVHADRVRIAQALGNLVANALEHGRGRVLLHARRDGERVRIAVRDDGPGPGPGAAARPGADGAAVRGHGLAVAADVAARHDGTLVRRAGHPVIDLPAAGRQR